MDRNPLHVVNYENMEPEQPSGVCGTETGADEAEAARLLEAIRRGDADAFERVAREQGQRLYRLALRLTGRREDAEDLVQDTLVRALPALRGFEGRSQVSTYLVRALTNQWKNRLRARSRSRLVDWFRGRGADADEEDLAPVDAAPSAERVLESQERALAVRQAVARLAPDRRLALLLREVEEMSYEEIAETTGVPVGTVRSRLARARDDLRKLIGGRP